MWQVRAGFEFLTLDGTTFSKTLNKLGGRIHREGVREWVRATYPEVPVWSGTSRGTLRVIGRMLRVTVPISPVVRRKGRGPDVGEAAASLNFQDTDFVYIMEWSPNVLWYELNEIQAHPRVASAPWFSTDAGNDAYIAYVDNRLENEVPNLLEFMSWADRE